MRTKARIGIMLVALTATATMPFGTQSAQAGRSTAQTAFAAIPTCTGVTWKNIGNYEVGVPTYGGSTNCTLSTNSAFVTPTKILQGALNDCNRHAGLVVDGIYGTRTKAAVQAVQPSGQKDGIYGPVTGHAMLWPSYTFPRVTCIRAI
jgi:peptidoglycan hydrolase-like protein with peptidoglycan-binding domain